MAQRKGRSGQSAGALVQTFEIDHIPSIAALSGREKLHLLPLLHRRQAMPNRIICSQGERGDFMAFIASGLVKIRTKKSKEDEFIVALLGPGEYFGEIGMITKRVRSFDVVAIKRTEYLELSRQDFIAHTQRFTGLSFALLVSFSGRLHDAGKRIVDLSEENLSIRVIRVLEKLAKPRQTIRGMRLVVEPRPALNDLLGLIGADRDKVWNTIRELERRGEITMEDERIIIESVLSF